MLSLGAQTQSKATGFNYTISAKADAYGLHSVTIRNVSKIDITAVHAFSTCDMFGLERGESSSVGSDSLLQFTFRRTKYIDFPNPALIQPGKSLQLDMPAIADSCRKGVSVLFADGHGEGDEDETYGWRQMIANRYSSYAELLRTRGIVESMSIPDAGFPESLLKVLDARRVSLADRNTRDVPKSEVTSRTDVLETLLRNLREPDRMPDDLKTRDSTLQLLNRWMGPLKKNCYDQPQL